jgi:hypothetical protein
LKDNKENILFYYQVAEVGAQQGPGMMHQAQVELKF